MGDSGGERRWEGWRGREGKLGRSLGGGVSEFGDWEGGFGVLGLEWG
jgi:hypothetical protein